MTMATKAGLIGMWRIDRQIRNLSGPDASFTGDGQFREQTSPDTLLWSEDGHLTIGDAAPVVATRRYLWHFGKDISVFFDDGRPFHSFAPTALAPAATHDCPPDTYCVSYSFDLPKSWTSRWQVNGPSKSYVMTSQMRRATAR